MKVLGLMSGTSMDGLDCCLADINMDNKYNFEYKIIKYKTYQYSEHIKNIIYKSLGKSKLHEIKYIDSELGKCFYEICKDFINKEKVEIISSHGQTIYHDGRTKTIQVGNPRYLYKYFNVPVFFNFREKDIILGGEGAPLMPFLDWLLFNKENKNLIILNIGGIANITYISNNGNRNEVVGYDTGPGMGLIDEHCKFIFGHDMDLNCIFSSKGNVDKVLLSTLLEDDFVNLLPPKSTTREYYGFSYLQKIYKKFNYLSNYDILRTLVKFTSEAILKNIKHIIDLNKIDKMIVSGGGSHHNILINDIKEKVSNLYLSDEYGIAVDSKEALLMCVLGYTCYKNLNNNMPNVTGASKYDVYGEVYE